MTRGRGRPSTPVRRVAAWAQWLAVALVALLVAQVAVLPAHLAAEHHRSPLDCHAEFPGHGHSGACDDDHDHEDHAHAAGDHQLDRVRRADLLVPPGICEGLPGAWFATLPVSHGPPTRAIEARAARPLVRSIGPRAPPRSALA